LAQLYFTSFLSKHSLSHLCHLKSHQNETICYCSFIERLSSKRLSTQRGFKTPFFSCYTLCWIN
jgi:hypothetical protein